MFSYGLESLLGHEPGLDIVGQAKDIDQAMVDIEQLQPDVVILDNSNLSGNNSSQALQILKTYPDIKVIDVSLQNNNLYVYRASRRVVESTEDLVAAVKADWATSNL